MKAKRFIAMLLSLVMCFALMAGCGGNNTSGNNTGGNNTSGNNTSGNNSGTSDDSSSTGPDSLVVRINGDPKSFNPTLISDDNLYKAAQNMYHRLT